MSNASQPSVLLIGIAWDQYDSMVGAGQKDAVIAEVKKALDSGEKQIQETGYGYEYMEYAPAQDASRLKQRLAEKEFAGVCVGIGIRRQPQFTPLFEMLVNTVHEHAPKTKLLFNSTPSDTVEAVKRLLPKL